MVIQLPTFLSLTLLGSAVPGLEHKWLFANTEISATVNRSSLSLMSSEGASSWCGLTMKHILQHSSSQSFIWKHGEERDFCRQVEKGILLEKFGDQLP